MKTINQIKEECIAIDMDNLYTGTVGVYVDGVWLQQLTENDVRLHYAMIDTAELLKYYVSYMGLRDISDAERSSYAIDIIELIK